MPRLTAIRITALERLAADLRFAPRTRVLHIVRAAEHLAATLSPNDAIDERDLVHTLTGYRPDLDEPAVMPGDALLADLSALVEHLTDTAAITETDLPKDSVSPDDLAARWNVSTKTIARFRRAGLIAWRVRTSAGTVTLRITPVAAESFERANNLRAKATARAAHLSQEERAHLARLALRLQQRFNWTRTHTARAIAQSTGRAYETIRRNLAADLGPPRTPATTKRRRDAHRRWLAGETTAAIARAIARTPATARAWIDARRRENILTLKLPPAEPPFAEPRASAALRAAITTTDLIVRTHPTAGDFVTAARDAPPANPAQLALLADARTALLLRARAHAQTPNRADAAETNLRWAELLRAKLVHLHTRLILDSIESTVAGALLELPPPAIRALHREAMRAALDGIALHDARRGGSISAAINVTLSRRLSRAPETPAARRALTGDRRAASPSAPLDDWTTLPKLWPDPLAAATTTDPALRDWLNARLARAGTPPLTRQDAAKLLNITPARAALLDRAARAQAR